jgi:hypothetical protein
MPEAVFLASKVWPTLISMLSIGAFGMISDPLALTVTFVLAGFLAFPLPLISGISLESIIALMYALLS